MSNAATLTPFNEPDGMGQEFFEKVIRVATRSEGPIHKDNWRRIWVDPLEEEQLQAQTSIPYTEALVAAVKKAGQVGELWPQKWLEDHRMSHENATYAVKRLRDMGQLIQDEHGYWRAG